VDGLLSLLAKVLYTLPRLLLVALSTDREQGGGRELSEARRREEVLAAVSDGGGRGVVVVVVEGGDDLVQGACGSHDALKKASLLLLGLCVGAGFIVVVVVVPALDVLAPVLVLA